MNDIPDKMKSYVRHRTMYAVYAESLFMAQMVTSFRYLKIP